MKAAKCFENFFPNFFTTNVYSLGAKNQRENARSCLVKYRLVQSESMSFKTDRPMKVDDFNEMKISFVDKSYDEFSDIEFHISM